MITELSVKQKMLTLVGMSVASTVIYALIMEKGYFVQMMYLALVSLLFTGDRPSIVYAICVCLPRDIKAAYRFLTLSAILFIWEKKNMTVARIFETQVMAKHPDKVAFLMDDVKLTFRDVERLSNQIAAFFHKRAFKRGDTIALVMENKPEYACIWLGLSKIGIVTALVNTNLRRDVLIHSIKAANSKAVIFGIELNDAIKEIQSDEEIKKLPLFHHKGLNQEKETGNWLGTYLNPELDKQSPETLLAELAKGTFKDKMVYIYTSGTTGLPKAAVISNSRYMFMVLGCGLMLEIRPTDVIYNALPLYHTAGGMVGLGNVILRGATMALRKKFSASNFWTDCIRYECTVAQYIGEICRYLLSAPSKPQDTQHKVRMMFGNGLRAQIWKQFVSRFRVENIGEVYGSTEGNSNLVNIDHTVGAVGFVPLFAHKFYPVTLVRCEEETGEPIRDDTGRCIRCQPGEPGVFIGKINYKRASSSFGGYADKKASEKKILHDVFREGDAYFNSGDILVTDLLGYFYFKDRTGDTFRWRGENVATSEVEAVISNIVGLHDCVVYGVDIPHVEGKAGMAAIVDPEHKTDLEQLTNGIRGSLPAYARPLFIRLIKELPMTGTFKMKKSDLVKASYHLDQLNQDPIYYLHSDGKYAPLTRKDYDDILNGKARL